MEFNSFSHIHIITEPGQSPANRPLYPAVSAAYSIETSVPAQWEALLDLAFLQSPEDIFCIVLKLPNHSRSIHSNLSWLPQLCILLSHPRYFKYRKGFLLMFDISNEDRIELEKFRELLSSSLQAQGFSHISLVNINQDEDDIVFYDQTNGQQAFEEWYTSRLLRSGGYLNIGAVNSDGVSIQQLVDRRTIFEKGLQEDQPDFYRLLLAFQASVRQNHEYEEQIELLTEDTRSKNVYIDFLLGKFTDGVKSPNEVMNIKNFYYKEYEVLPLWYKRFGHILKVLTGKRSFRSLYDKNVKKYKP